MSVALPAENGTMTLIGCLVGHSWAFAATELNSSASAAQPTVRVTENPVIAMPPRSTFEHQPAQAPTIK
jgi:hypothetical protein